MYDLLMIIILTFSTFVLIQLINWCQRQINRLD
ncbi:hypothetical protein SAMN05421791_104128 [Facklamia miroungae]|uniref:Uncharacterized protein n=1 Tax=Facklamia miroungae TaxID=120956 RepID=A0A1G7ST60_9LACT|nr:hypothetical protein SAMN05421791_104128 [Facklamia miroungae]